jgi:mannan endo-1,4-beta-mannosidase
MPDFTPKKPYKTHQNYHYSHATHTYSVIRRHQHGRLHLDTCLLYICVLFAFSYLAQSINGDSFVKTQGTEFVVDGHPFLFNGFNSYWMMHVVADPSERNKVTEVFSEAAANGLTVCRTWAFSDGGDKALQLSPGLYDEHVFEVVNLCINM